MPAGQVYSVPLTSTNVSTAQPTTVEKTRAVSTESRSMSVSVTVAMSKTRIVRVTGVQVMAAICNNLTKNLRGNFGESGGVGGYANPSMNFRK